LFCELIESVFFCNGLPLPFCTSIANLGRLKYVMNIPMVQNTYM
jgi:hypothetical protein